MKHPNTPRNHTQPYEPTPAEIAEACAEIRSQWPDGVQRAHDFVRDEGYYVPGDTSCLSCGITFESRCRLRLRYCDECRDSIRLAASPSVRDTLVRVVVGRKKLS